MKVRDLLNVVQTDYNKIIVKGKYEHGLTTLYKGDVGTLREILKVNDILEAKNWGGINEEYCFLLRDIDCISGDSEGLWICVTMPDSYTHEDKNGNRLNEFIEKR